MSNKTTEYYTQCNLVLRSNKNITTTSWLPNKYVGLNKVVSLKDKDTWNDWVIVGVGNSVSAEYIEEYKDAYRDHRKFSDI